MFRCLDVDVKAWCCHGNNWSRNYILIFSFMGWPKKPTQEKNSLSEGSLVSLDKIFFFKKTYSIPVFLLDIIFTLYFNLSGLLKVLSMTIL